MDEETMELIQQLTDEEKKEIIEMIKSLLSER